MTHTPLLSLVVGGKNDDYMGDFKWRLATCINFLARSLAECGRLKDVEMVVCDWGSPSPLHETLNLSPEARAISRFVLVPPETASHAQQDSPFPIPIVQNVAIRRCRGEFIAQTDSDILFTRRTIANLLSILDGKDASGFDIRGALMVCSRRHIPYELAEAKPSCAELGNYLNHYGSMLPYEKLIPGFATPSGLALLHRSVWESCGAYDERLIYWGWMEIDLYLRLCQRHPWVDLDGFGVNLFHIEHYPSRAQGGQTRKANPMRVAQDFRANSPAWGMAQTDLKVFSFEAPKTNWAEGSASSLRASKLSKLTDSEILEGISNLKHVHAVAETVLKVKEHIRGSEEFLASLQLYDRVLQSGVVESFDFRAALRWYTSEFKPLTYLEVGVGSTDALIYVASSFRPVEMYGVGTWDPLDGTRVIHGPENIAEILAKNVGHSGYVRYVSGFTADELDTFLSHPATPAEFDLVFVNGFGDPGQTIEKMKKVFPKVSHGGAIVVGGASFAINDAELRSFAGRNCTVCIKN